MFFFKHTREEIIPTASLNNSKAFFLLSVSDSCSGFVESEVSADSSAEQRKYFNTFNC